MTNQRPITPPPELVEEWIAQVWHEGTPVQVAASDIHIATQAARWGADQELEACCADIHTVHGQHRADWLRSMRRPKPQNLKEQALAAHGEEPLPESGPTGDTILNVGAIERHRLIRRALEQLDD